MNGKGGGISNQNPLFIQRDEIGTSNAKATIELLAEDNFGNSRFLCRSGNVFNAEAVSISANRADYGSYHCYAARLDLSGLMSLFIDGELMGTNQFDQTGDFLHSVDYVELGRKRFANGGSPLNRGFLNGVIDEVTIYNCALSTDDIQRICMLNVATENISETELYLKPNPVSETLEFSWEKQLVRAQLNIFNSSGQVVFQSAVSGNKALIDVTGLASGVYIYELSHAQSISKGKVIIQH